MNFYPRDAGTLIALSAAILVTGAAIIMTERTPDPKPVQTTKIEIPAPLLLIDGPPMPRPDPRKAHDWDVDYEHLAMLLKWRAELATEEDYCRFNIC